MKNVDITAGQYFCEKGIDLYSATPREAYIRRAIKGKTLSDVVDEENNFQDILNLMMSAATDSYYKNNNFNIIRDRSNVKQLISEADCFYDRYDGFTTGSFDELNEKIKYHEMETAKRCPRCGSMNNINLPIYMRFDTLCIKCRAEEQTHADYFQSLEKLDR